MSNRFLQVQNDGSYRSGSPRPHKSGSHRSSSESSNSSASSSSSHGSHQQQHRHSMDRPQPYVVVLRCSRCAKCVEAVSSGRGNDDASASGMVRFGHNLYYCDRCAKLVGYK